MTSYPETAHDVLGVPGRMYPRHTRPDAPELFSAQKWVSESRSTPALKNAYGTRALIRAEIRFDDECRNGKHSFTITGEIYRPGVRDVDACGCLHDEIAHAFPELAPLIQWHLWSTDGGMHYAANAAYLASDRDYRGKLAGEPYAWAEMVSFADVPMLHKVPKGLRPFLDGLADHDDAGKRAEMVPIAVAYVPGATDYKFAPKWQYAGQPPLKWHDCPFESEDDAARFAESFIRCLPKFHAVPTLYSEGKARDLDAARRVANWPEATDAELCVEKAELVAALNARLPGLLARFEADVRGAGFAWTPAELSAAVAS